MQMAWAMGGQVVKMQCFEMFRNTSCNVCALFSRFPDEGHGPKDISGESFMCHRKSNET